MNDTLQVWQFLFGAMGVVLTLGGLLIGLVVRTVNHERRTDQNTEDLKEFKAEVREDIGTLKEDRKADNQRIWTKLDAIGSKVEQIATGVAEIRGELKAGRNK